MGDRVGFDLAAFNRQAYWRAFTTLVGIQALGCAIISYTFGEVGERLNLFFLIFVSLFIIGIINTVLLFVGKIALGLWDNSRQFEAMFLDDLRKMGVPPPGPHHSRTWAYLSEVADDEAYPANQRVAAARLFADASHMMKGLPFMQLIQCEKAFDAATIRFSDERPVR